MTIARLQGAQHGVHPQSPAAGHGICEQLEGHSPPATAVHSIGRQEPRPPLVLPALSPRPAVLEQQLQNQLYRAGRSLYEMAWRPEHVAPLAQRWGDDDEEPLFCILQSTLEIPIQEVEDLMRRAPASTSPSRTTG